MAVDQPQSTAERMAQNVAQLAQQRREEQALAQQQAELQQAEIDDIYSDTLDDKAEEAEGKRLDNLIKAAQAAKGEPKPKPTAGEKIESSLTSLGSFIPPIKIPGKEDREARRAQNTERRRRMAELAGKTSLSSGTALGVSSEVDARDVDPTFKGPKLTDAGPSGGKGMTMTENPGRKQVAK